MSLTKPRGKVYRCAVCGAEVAAVGAALGEFAPVCCNQPMQPVARRLEFYRCPICGAEIAVLAVRRGVFSPVCCNQPMRVESAA